MYSRIRNDLERAIQKIKWFAQLLSERVRLEIEFFRLSSQSEELRSRRDRLFRIIGEEIYMTHKNEKSVYANGRILEALSEIEALDPKIREIDEKLSDISRIS